MSWNIMDLVANEQIYSIHTKRAVMKNHIILSIKKI